MQKEEAHVLVSAATGTNLQPAIFDAKRRGSIPMTYTTTPRHSSWPP
jgi:hypothetical protein